MFHRIKSTIFTLLLSSLHPLFMLGKVSFIVGSKAAFFSLSQCLTPLVGRYGSTQGSLIYFLTRTLLKILLTGTLSFLILLYHIPSFFQSLYFSLITPYSNRPASFLAKLGFSLLCLMCMIDFTTHEVGKHAFYYSFLWIFPAAMPFIRTNNFFLHALASTFVAHAVGSIMALHINPMIPEVWMALIPLVCIERLLFAVGTVILGRVYERGINQWPRLAGLYKNLQTSYQNG